MPKPIAAIKNKMTLMPKMISEIVKPDRLKVYKANTSIPSMAQPPRMPKPIPTPKKTPPKIEINNLSDVMTG